MRDKSFRESEVVREVIWRWEERARGPSRGRIERERKKKDVGRGEREREN